MKQNLRPKPLPSYVVLIFVLLGILFLSPSKVFAATTYTVTNTNDSGAGSLRQAISDANSNVGADQIDFAISGAGPHTIVLASGLSITDQVKVNGLSQIGSVCNGTSSTIKVVIEGNGIGVSGAVANGTEINGLVFGTGTNNLVIGGDTSSNIVRCNFFGTNASGTTGVGTLGNSGLTVYGASTTIGGNSVTDMNLFGYYNLSIGGGNNQTIKNNQFGTDITGMTVLGGDVNFAFGTWNNITISHNLIRHMNMIYSTFDNLTLSANKIGTNITGTAAIQENLGDPIWIRSSFNNSTIGGPTEADGNLIAGAYPVDSNQQGIALVAGGSNLTIQNNKLGVNADASGVIGNYNTQLVVGCANNCVNIQILDNIIGGSQGGSGISITNSGDSDQNSIYVKRNYIGTNKTLDLDAGNTSGGIRLSGSISHVLIGGSDTADANYIYNNGAPGITDTSTGFNSYLGNSIYSNEGQGIDFPYFWNPDPENSLNYPVITLATENGGNTDVNYILDVPAGDYRVEFFSNTTADPTGYGEGETFIGHADVTSDGTGEQTFTTTLSGTGHTHLAATATQIDPDSFSGFGPTSEFGNFEPRADLEVASDDGTTSANYGDTHQYKFTVSNNGPGDVDNFTFQGHSSVFDSAVYAVVDDSSTATTPGYFSDGGWNGLLKSGETLEFTMSGTINNTGPLNTTNICIVQDSTLQIEGVTVVDPDSDNNCGTDDDTVVPVPTTDLSLTKTLDAPGTVKNGNQATYTLTVTNNGPMSQTRGTVIYDLTPPGTSFHSSSGDKFTCEDIGPSSGLGNPGIPDGGLIECYDTSDDGVSNGESSSVQITLDINSIDETQSITNYAAAINPNDSDDYNAIITAYSMGENFFALDINGVDYATYDPNASADNSDTDNISDDVENAAPNSGDANNDGTPDSEQNNVASFVNTVIGEYAVLEVSSECSMTSVSINAEPTSTPDPSFSYPTGLMDFTLDCDTNGFTANITQYYYEVDSTDFVVRKYNPTTKTYTTIDGASLSNTTIYSKNVTKASYQVKDGSSLDLDGTEDGNIHDPAGLGQTTDSLAYTGQNSTPIVLLATSLLVTGTTGLVVSARKRQNHRRLF